jgi:hypothetical protein
MALTVTLVSAEEEVWHGEANLVVAKTVEGDRLHDRSRARPRDPCRRPGAYHAVRRHEGRRRAQDGFLSMEGNELTIVAGHAALGPDRPLGTASNHSRSRTHRFSGGGGFVVREETTHADPVAAVGDKRPGGRERLDIGALALPELRAARDAAVDALVALSGDERHAARVLKLSRRQRPDIAHNATLRTAPTLPAVDRYTGVLFDALDAATLDAASRRWLGAHVLIHSAPFGPVGALDAIPTYRLAAGTARSRHPAPATTLGG